jgi:hypothetical protein
MYYITTENRESFLSPKKCVMFLCQNSPECKYIPDAVKSTIGSLSKRRFCQHGRQIAEGRLD